MALGKRERRSVAHQQRKCAVLANGLGHFPDPQIVVIIKGLGKLNDRPTGESAEQLQPKRFMFGPSCSEIAAAVDQDGALRCCPQQICFRKIIKRRRIDGQRSEEHTSELQSLMRISYAVFCLKKKNTKE